MQKRDRTLWIALFSGWMLIGFSFSLNDYLFRNKLEAFEHESLGLLFAGTGSSS
jgi:hypothetical protein